MKKATSVKKFFHELNDRNIDGVALKNRQLRKDILGYFTNSGNASITELSRHLNTSVPKTTELINSLIEYGFVKDHGKGENGVGRRPNLYGLSANSVYFVGVDVKTDYVNIGLVNFNKELVKAESNVPFSLQNTQESLEKLCSIIQRFIKKDATITQHIAGIGINLTGRINCLTGQSYSVFNFTDLPLSQVIEKKFDIPVYLENDSRAMAYGEFCNGLVTTEKNVLYVNVDYGIGMGTMINGSLYYGKSGFAGEFGHIKMFDNEVICQCGKKGCLETEASGRALVNVFSSRLRAGESSILTNKATSSTPILLNDIINASVGEDMLAIESIALIGEKLGQGIATLINLYNPELVIVGGALSRAGDYLFLPMKTSINRFSISLVRDDTDIKMSKLGEQAGIIGACLLVRDRLLSTSVLNNN